MYCHTKLTSFTPPSRALKYATSCSSCRVVCLSCSLSLASLAICISKNAARASRASCDSAVAACGCKGGGGTVIGVTGVAGVGSTGAAEATAGIDAAVDFSASTAADSGEGDGASLCSLLRFTHTSTMNATTSTNTMESATERPTHVPLHAGAADVGDVWPVLPTPD